MRPPPLSPNSGSSIEQRAYKKVHWTERGYNTFESSRLLLVMGVSSLKMNGTSVGFTCSTWQSQLQIPQRERQRRSPCPLNRDSHGEQPNQINVY